MDRRAWPSFCLYEENPSDVEAALDTSRCLTGTIARCDPDTLKGRDRGTKDFLVAWRVIVTAVQAEAKGAYGRPRRCVWCPFPADTEQVKPSVRTKRSRGCILWRSTKNEGAILSSFAVRPL